MNPLSFSQMEVLNGGKNYYWTGYSCAMAAISLATMSAAMFAVTGPLAVVAIGMSGAAVTSVFSGACGVNVAMGN